MTLALDTPLTASEAALAAHQPQGPDFSACEAFEGQLFGACVAGIAQSYRDVNEPVARWRAAVGPRRQMRVHNIAVFT